MSKSRQLYYSDLFTPNDIDYYMGDPIAYIHDVIFNKHSVYSGGEYDVDKQQEEVIWAVLNNDFTTVKSAKGTGKTTLSAWLTQWWMVIYPDRTKVICSGPSAATLYGALWSEISIWLNMSLAGNLFEFTQRRIVYREHDAKQREMCYAIPRTATVKENMQGLHSPHLLVIVDECSAVDDDILNALESTMTSGKKGDIQKMLYISNPTRTSGYFYDSHMNPSKKKMWSQHTLTALKSSLIKPQIIEMKRDQYGEAHDLYQIDILGNFPSGNSDAFIELYKVEAAIQRDYIPQDDDVIEIGVDVALGGDDSCIIAWRHGYKVTIHKKIPKIQADELENEIIKLVQHLRLTTGYKKTISIKVDVGGLGSYLPDYLNKHREDNINVIGCNFGSKGDELCADYASVMWNNVRVLIDKIDLPDDNDLRMQLSSRRYELDKGGRFKIESKKIYKRDFKHSPDEADAIVLLFAEGEKEQTIIRNFDALDPAIVKDSLQFAGKEVYASVFYTKDLHASIVYCSWDGEKICVLDEHSSSDQMVNIAVNLHKHMPLARIYGNSDMFSKNGDDLASKFRKFNIKFSENYTYNELAAIELLSNSIYQRKIVIHKRCSNLIYQLSSWKIEKSRVITEQNFGLCLALCNIITVLRRRYDTNSIQMVKQEAFKDEPELKQLFPNSHDSWMSFG